MQAADWHIAIVGAGNLAWSLAPALQRAGAQVIQLISRQAGRRAELAARCGIPGQAAHPADLDPAANLVLLTVPDGAVAEVTAQLPPGGALVAHTSGSSPLAGRPGQRAVLYPLQTFTWGIPADFQAIPIFVEADPPHLEPLLALAQAMSPQAYALDSGARLQLHHGAVWASNFVNLMLRIASQVMPEPLAGHPGLELYAPLLREQIRKALAAGPAAAQTGPALRGDRETITRHLALLDGHADWQELYRLLSRAIRPEAD
jgi:predicted short-subunit dehydrogenase-like oxidoreductase (DUF2520 family)